MQGAAWLLASSLIAWFIAATVASGATLVEPTTNADGSPVDDLASCRAIVTNVVTGETGSQEFTAQPGGGQSHTFDPAAILDAPLRLVDGDCIDASGNRGALASSQGGGFRLDRLAPSVPVVTP